MVQKIGQITNADCYMNDTDLKGRVEELDMGEFALTEVEHASLGMIGVLKLPGRPVEAIEGKINFNWVDAEIEKMLLNPTKVVRLQLHSYVDIFGPDGLDVAKSHTLVTHIGFMPLKRGGGTAKLGDKMQSEYAISITSFSQKVYGEAVPIIEYDGWNGIYNVNGEPVWPN